MVEGSAKLSDGEAQPAPLVRGTVMQNRPDGHYEVHTGEDIAQLLTYYGGTVQWSDQTYADAHSEVGGVPTVSRRFDYTDAEDNPFHMPEMGFLHMSARWLIDSTNGGSSRFTMGQSTFAPGDGCHQLHRHPNAEEVFYVWEGEGSHLTADGQEIAMKAGELAFVAKNEWHGFRNTGGTPLKAIFGYLGANSLEGGGYELPETSR